MRKEPSTATKMNGDSAPKLIDLTDRIRAREDWRRHPRTLSTMLSFQKVYPHYIHERSGGKDPRPTEPCQEYAPKLWVERGARIQEQLGFGGASAAEVTKQLTPYMTCPPPLVKKMKSA